MGLMSTFIIDEFTDRELDKLKIGGYTFPYEGTHASTERGSID